MHLDKKDYIRLIEGDEAVLKKVINIYGNFLFCYCLKFTKSSEIAEEIVQDVFTKVWENRTQLNPDLSFKAYLYQITKNLAFNYLKKAASEASFKKRFSFYSDSTHNRPEEDCIFRDYEKFADNAIKMLPPQRKIIFQMSRQEEMSHDEIAASLGISKNTVKVQIVKAAKTIKKHFQLYTDIAFNLSLPFLILFS